VAITAPTNGATFAYGANIALTASTTDDLSSVTNVSFLREITKLGQDTSSPFSFAWNSAPAGTFTLRATATDNFGASATSAPVTINILAPLGTNAYAVKVNFQTNSAALVPGHLPDAGLVFANRGNGYSYGWDLDNTAHSRYRNSVNAYDLRYDTFNHLQKPGGGTTWEIAVPNGTYQVRLVAGDPDFFDGNFQLAVEGLLLVSGAPSTTTRWLEGIGIVTVTDGRLTVSNAPGAGNNKICFIEITSLAQPLLPALLAPQLLPDGSLSFLVQGSDGVNYVVEASTNLTVWVPVFTNTTVGSVFPFIDPSPTNQPMRFYRGRLQ
jgi:hypothetical protein